MKARIFIAIAALGLVFGAACRHRSPTAVLHTLRPLSEKPAQAHPFTSIVEVMPFRLPEMLQRPQLVITREKGGLGLSETHRWGNGLEEDMRRVLMENLSILLGGESAVPFPAGEGTKAAYRVSVDVLVCEGRPGGTLRLEARWTLSRPGGKAAPSLHKTETQEPVRGLSMEDLVEAHDRALATLSREIAAGLEAQSTMP